eukprot:TRINITY_DN5934_c0_g1_i1.p1 TRINITY_DN5934_c0_g1~~TRINITY_DN5934_c0_g1_i1.p1  ORF type:complete len:315 (+),score=66.37 TRINITY_DN5934_c0_g1_i1:51-995(+)
MDEGTYWARVQRMWNIIDFRTIFVSDSQLQNALKTIETAKREKAERSASSVSPSDLAQAHRIKEAVVHPDTGHKILLPLRASFIIPANMVLDAAMLSARTLPTTIAAQWLNQTYNAMHYWANRNASNSEPVSRVVQSYVGAVISSVSAAVGLNYFADKSATKWSPILVKSAPFFAVAAADIVNLGCMRQNEFLQGINVYDDHGDLVGKSKTAGYLAVGACIGGRIAAAAPILLIPPFLMDRLEQKGGWIHNYPRLKTPVLLGMVGAAIAICVPLTFGIFRQTAWVHVSHLEPELQGRKDKEGNPVEKVWYNKGL